MLFLLLYRRLLQHHSLHLVLFQYQQVLLQSTYSLLVAVAQVKVKVEVLQVKVVVVEEVPED